MDWDCSICYRCGIIGVKTLIINGRSSLCATPCFSALFARLGGPVPEDFPLRVRLPGSSRSPSAEDGDVNMALNVWGSIVQPLPRGVRGAAAET